MKNLLPNKLRIDQLEELEKQNRVTYFNYLGNLDRFLEVPEEEILKILKGKNHAIVDKHLYTKSGNFDYDLGESNWKESKEYKGYEPLLQKMRFIK